MNLYDARHVSHLYLWNQPPTPKFAEGTHVTANKKPGTITSVLPSPATSGARCRETHYFVSFGNEKDSVMFAESEITPNNQTQLP